MRLRHAFLVLFLAPAATAQSLNVDLGDPSSGAGTPIGTYGAAADSPGLWNEVDPSSSNSKRFNSGPLFDLTGAPTVVEIEFLSSALDYFDFEFDEPNTAGSDQALLDDITSTSGAHTLTVTGLAPGRYLLFTYAMAPDSSTDVTTVHVPGSVDPLAFVGGTFGGGFVRDVTHAEHEVTVTAGESVTIEVDFVSSRDSLSGLQVVSLAATSIGSPYCPGVVNSTGNAGELTAFGRPEVSDNDVTLTTTGLPASSFAFYLASTAQGLVTNPGGSDGNLCLGGSIGRYVGPGQILNAGVAGEVSLVLDLTMTPTPTGFVSVAAGETWNYQTWYRDAPGGVATSNLSNGLSIGYL
ncbi:MAG: hypothetical protein AAGB93_02385 [Planctomycetota bacterium]